MSVSPPASRARLRGRRAPGSGTPVEDRVLAVDVQVDEVGAHGRAILRGVLDGPRRAPDQGFRGACVDSAHALGTPWARGRARARGLLGRHFGAPGHPPRARRWRDDGRVGPDLVHLALALVALPAAYVARRRPQAVFVAGTVVFSVASLTCGLVSDFGLLVAARCVQAVGAAAIVTAAIVLLTAATGSERAALRIWVSAGVFGAALGPRPAGSSPRCSAGARSSLPRCRWRS